MSKFWGVVGTLFVIGMVLVLLGNQAAGINFSDLETECRYDRQEQTDVDVHASQNRLSFDGQFPVNNTESHLTYTYTVEDGEIVLNVRTDSKDEPTDFYNKCLGVAVYNAETSQLSDGRYRVEVQHDGVKVEEKVIVFG